MELPLKVIVVAAILILVLVVVSSFFLQSTGESMTKAEAERVFSSRCLTYGQRSCEWAVAYEPEFQDYLKACRILYGSYRESFSCLYSLCSRCFESADLKCSGLCYVCNGHEYSGVSREECCSKYRSECAGSAVKCDRACGGVS